VFGNTKGTGPERGPGKSRPVAQSPRIPLIRNELAESICEVASQEAETLPNGSAISARGLRASLEEVDKRQTAL
jgi:hypothetical protein